MTSRGAGPRVPRIEEEKGATPSTSGDIGEGKRS